jgi:lysophospholipase L1-like esterase
MSVAKRGRASARAASAPPRVARARRPLATAALAVGSVVVALALAEGATRLVRPGVRDPFQIRLIDESERGKFCVYHPTLGWAGKPSVDDVYESFDCRHRVRQNALGFRGPDVPFARGAARRLVVLGDSFVWGFGVENDDVFTARLARASRAPLEVVNLGVSGYGTDQELLLWRLLGAQFQPDDVLLVVTPYTDVFDVTATERYHYPKPIFRLGPSGPTLENVPVPRREDGRWDVEGVRRLDVQGLSLLRVASRSALVSAALQAATARPSLRAALERRGLIAEREPGIDVEQKLLVSPLPDDARRGWDVVVALVGVLADEVAAAHGHLTVAIAPTPLQVYPDLWETFRREHGLPSGARWDRDAPERTLAAACAARGVPVVDLLPALREAARTDPYLYFRWNMHWTPAGHRVVAATLARAFGG